MKTTTKTVRRVDPQWLRKEIGKRIRVERQRKGMTLQAVAADLGVSRACVNNWELANQDNMLVRVLYDLALLFEIPVRRLLP